MVEGVLGKKLPVGELRNHLLDRVALHAHTAPSAFLHCRLLLLHILPYLFLIYIPPPNWANFPSSLGRSGTGLAMTALSNIIYDRTKIIQNSPGCPGNRRPPLRPLPGLSHLLLLTRQATQTRPRNSSRNQRPGLQLGGARPPPPLQVLPLQLS